MGTVTPIRPLKQGSFHPSSFTDQEFNLIRELSDNRDKYVISKGEDYSTISFLFFPNICDDNLERVRHRVEKGRRPGLHPTCSACIANGVQSITSDKNLRELVKLKERFDSAKSDTDGNIATLVAEWFRNFHPKLPSGRRQNIKVPAAIYSPLAAFSKGLGMPTHTVALLAMMDTLADEECCIVDHAVEMRGYVETFRKTASMRVVGIAAILDAYQL